jgi:hypothetical protein
MEEKAPMKFDFYQLTKALTSSQNVVITIEALFVSSVIKFSIGNKTTRGRRRLFNTSFEFEPCVIPAPSAKIFSNSGVAPPVINARKKRSKIQTELN